MPRIGRVLILGIIVGDLSDSVPTLYWLMVSALCLFSAPLLKRHSATGSLSLLSATLFLGALLINISNNSDIQQYPQTRQHYTAIVASPPAEKAKTHAFDLITAQANGEECRLKAYIQKTERANRLNIGDTIECKSTWERLQTDKRYEYCNYHEYLLRQGFCCTTYIADCNWKSFSDSAYTQPPKLSILSRLKLKALHIRQSIIHKIRSQNLTADNLSLLAAMAFGDKHTVSKEVRNEFSIAGAAHLLALSGLHLSIIISVLSCLLFFMGKRVRSMAILMVVWSYAFIAGCPVSMVRAASMFTIVLVADASNRRSYPTNTLATAAVIILLVSPQSLFDIGFQLSFASMLSIYMFSNKLLNLLPKPCLHKGNIAHYIATIFTISISAQIGIFPLILHYFGTFPTYFIITNAFVGLFALAILALTLTVCILLLLPAHSLITAILSSATTALDSVVSILHHIISGIASLPYSSIENCKINIIQTVLLYTILFIIYRLFTKLRTHY